MNGLPFEHVKTSTLSFLDNRLKSLSNFLWNQWRSAKANLSVRSKIALKERTLSTFATNRLKLLSNFREVSGNGKKHLPLSQRKALKCKVKKQVLDLIVEF